MFSLVVFHDRFEGKPAWYARYLEPGFKHCFVCVRATGGWIRIDGADGKIQIEPLAHENLTEHYEAQGCTVVPTIRFAVRTPLIANTCVGLVKAVLGIHSLAVTPYQLYKRLI